MSFFRTLPTKLSFNTSEKIQIANAEDPKSLIDWENDPYLL